MGELYLQTADASAIENAQALGREVAQGLIDRGARELMRQAEAAVLRRSQLN